MIQLDLNNPEFQANLLALPQQEPWAVLKTLRMLQARMQSAALARAGQHRSAAEQIEYWAALGQQVAGVLDPDETDQALTTAREVLSILKALDQQG